ncbi:Deoxyhypusine hydroxylase [Porphyridium purpureum]|uniref:Deoxyhypusine hydroxylase n=1 Tax=Porphyridium purpureum TaxID=35688 RepID=A0A5J4YP03_PORPP|nr:Deoxyhypusine hydroxylase [Porphyridium purpureum]|eukprot:POR4433..scf295_9
MAAVESVEQLRERLLSGTADVATRMRTVFALKGLGSDEAVHVLGSALLRETSALVAHEICYVLGQMKLESAMPVLTETLKDTQRDAMVRHEAAEALGAIGAPHAAEILAQFEHDAEVVVAETCQVALERIRWLNSPQRAAFDLEYGQYRSVDPAPAIKLRDSDGALKTQACSVEELRRILMDGAESLFTRYTAMFSLRNMHSEESIKVLCDALHDPSALFRHEIAFVLGQMADARSVPALKAVLLDVNEHAMVRHEAAEALGAIASDECDALLHEFRHDPSAVVRESCLVALDISEYNNSDQMHYTDRIVNA